MLLRLLTHAFMMRLAGTLPEEEAVIGLKKKCLQHYKILVSYKNVFKKKIMQLSNC